MIGSGQERPQHLPAEVSDGQTIVERLVAFADSCQRLTEPLGGE